MKWQPRKNWRWAIAVAALPLALTAFASARDSAAVKSAQPKSKPPARAPSNVSSGAGANLDLTRLNRKKSSAGSVDLFPSRSIYPVSPRQPQPAAPSVPPLPFRFIGKLVDGDSVTLFLEIGNQDYSVSLNDVLNNTYRVDQINEDSAVFTYLPLDTQQTLYMGRKD